MHEAGQEGDCLTCDIEVGIARSFAQLVGDDTLVDTSMLRSHSGEHQAMDIPVWGGTGGDNDTGPELGGPLRGGPMPPQAWPFSPTHSRRRRGGKDSQARKKCVHHAANPRSRPLSLHLQPSACVLSLLYLTPSDFSSSSHTSSPLQPVDFPSSPHLWGWGTHTSVSKF